jgi:hypothetical protein
MHTKIQFPGCGDVYISIMKEKVSTKGENSRAAQAPRTPAGRANIKKGAGGRQKKGGAPPQRSEDLATTVF